MDETAGVYKFVSVGELSETVTQMLALGIQYRTTVGGSLEEQQKSGLEQIEHLILQQARDYLSDVREGFALTVRTQQLSDKRELQFLLDRMLINWHDIWDELGLADVPNDAPLGQQGVPSNSNNADQADKLTRVHQQLLAFGMAAVALGHLPRMPAETITFPHSYSKPATYADIPTPDSPGKLLSRIDELEQMIWRLMEGNLQYLVNRQYGALRRTYGFFEASAHLASREAERFGVKRKQPQLSFL
ncbi:MAG: hypothetical protein R2867_42085 [Caldilineaceae bacterium]